MRPRRFQRLKRIEEAMGPALNGVKLYVKRDDLLGLGGGGNKLRKLEYLMGDAAAERLRHHCRHRWNTVQFHARVVAAASCAREKGRLRVDSGAARSGHR